MKEAIELFASVAFRLKEAIPDPGEAVQLALIRSLVVSIIESAGDYVRVGDQLSTRSAAILARTAIEAVFKLRAACLSKDLAIRIAFTMADDFASRAKKLFLADSNPPAGAREVIGSATKERDEILATSDTQMGSMKTITVFEIAEKVGCIGYYRGHYFNLSSYVHSSYKAHPTADTRAIDRIVTSAFMLALCLGIDSIAVFSNLSDASDVMSRSKALWEKSMENLPQAYE